jgi:hypothetical protein
MVPRFDLSKRRLATLEEKIDNRAKSLEMVRRFNAAQRKLERICKEKGIPVPVMVC